MTRVFRLDTRLGAIIGTCKHRINPYEDAYKVLCCDVSLRFEQQRHGVATERWSQGGSGERVREIAVCACERVVSDQILSVARG